MTSKGLKKYCISTLLGLGVFLYFSNPVNAQIVCTGEACPMLPLNQTQLNQMSVDFSTQVAKPLVKNFARASANANTMTPMIGSVNLTGWTFGTAVNAGYYDAPTKDVYIANVGTMDDVKPSAAQIFPFMYFGINLGSVLGHSYNPYNDSEKDRVPGLLSPARFDIYLMGLKYTHRQRIEEDGKLIGRGRYTIVNKGVQIRYHLHYGKEWLGSFLRWNGTSIAFGMMDSSTRAQITDKKASSYEFSLDSGNKLIWMGNYNVARISSSTKTYPVEIQSGIQFLYLFTLVGGAGVAWHSGRTELTIYRSGLAYLDSDLAAILGVNTPASNLSLFIHEEDAPPAFTYFGKLGLELNLAFIKIGIQGMANDEKSYGGQIGIRMEF